MSHNKTPIEDRQDIYRYYRPSTACIHHIRAHLMTFQVSTPITVPQHHGPAKDLGPSLGGELPPCVSRIKSTAGKTHCLSAQLRFRSNSYHGASVSAHSASRSRWECVGFLDGPLRRLKKSGSGETQCGVRHCPSLPLAARTLDALSYRSALCCAPPFTVSTPLLVAPCLTLARA